MVVGFGSRGIPAVLAEIVREGGWWPLWAGSVNSGNSAFTMPQRGAVSCCNNLNFVIVYQAEVEALNEEVVHVPKLYFKLKQLEDVGTEEDAWLISEAAKNPTNTIFAYV